MADPKYAGLPGIAYDQPDTYETSDLPESEQDLTEADGGGEATSPSFEVLHVTASEARDRFKGEVLHAGDVDFSDKISRHKRTGYPSNRPIEWSLGGDGAETVVERYQRLQCELTQLQQDLQTMKGTVPHGAGSVSAVALSASVNELHNTLHELALEETLGKEAVSAVSEPEAVLHKKLVNLLESFKSTGIVTEKKEGAGPPAKTGQPGVVYELYYAPEHSKLRQMARASQLEKRLDQLETLIGNNPEKMSVLSTWTNHRTLLSAAQALSARLALLEPAHLDHVEGRLHAVHTRMNAIAERRAGADDAQKQSKVSDLYEVTRKCEALCATLPEIVDRLASVEELHHEAAQFSRSLKQLDAAQTQVETNLQTNATLLTAVQEKFASNLNTVQGNVKKLDERIQALAKKGAK